MNRVVLSFVHSLVLIWKHFLRRWALRSDFLLEKVYYCFKFLWLEIIRIFFKHLKIHGLYSKPVVYHQVGSYVIFNLFSVIITLAAVQIIWTLGVFFHISLLFEQGIQPHGSEIKMIQETVTLSSLLHSVVLLSYSMTSLPV